MRFQSASTNLRRFYAHFIAIWKCNVVVVVVVVVFFFFFLGGGGGRTSILLEKLEH